MKLFPVQRQLAQSNQLDPLLTTFDRGHVIALINKKEMHLGKHYLLKYLNIS